MPLYPEITNPKKYEIEVDSPHKIYVEECGNPKGIPVIFLHGGPGSGCNESHRRYFNPKKYRIVLFDQRGCGLSTPNGCLDKNTTHDLIADIETIRVKLKIDQWLVFAGSWGVTLALLYAQTYKERVLGMILRGSFLASKRDMDWFFSEGVCRLFPELWEDFSTGLPKLNESETLLQTYHRCLFTDDKELNAKAALAWIKWTDSIVTWTLPVSENEASDQEKAADKMSSDKIDKLIRSVRLEVHYAINQYFLEEDYLLNNMDKIQGLPTILVHGRRDITCPLESSWRIHQALAGSELRILPNAGHLAGEPDMIEALVSATDDMLEKLER
ncbi:MAG: prolyl aminopeptidase [Cocleimonas sp.]